MKKSLYNIAKNNYVAVLFFSIVIFSLAYVINYEYKELDNKDLDTSRYIEEPTSIELEEDDPLVKELLSYLNTGDNETYVEYQTMYNKNKITNKNFKDEDMLYIAYKYLERNNDFSSYLTEISSDEGLYDTYYINTYVTKDLLRETVKKIFNVNLYNFVSFYTNYDDICEYENEEYTCIVKHNPSNNSEVQFVKAIKDDQEVIIYQKYKYNKYDNSYKTFNGNEIGEGYYKIVFRLINDNYYFESSELIPEEN
jgi:hypothetical protein